MRSLVAGMEAQATGTKSGHLNAAAGRFGPRSAASSRQMREAAGDELFEHGRVLTAFERQLDRAVLDRREVDRVRELDAARARLAVDERWASSSSTAAAKSRCASTRQSIHSVVGARDLDRLPLVRELGKLVRDTRRTASARRRARVTRERVAVFEDERAALAEELQCVHDPPGRRATRRAHRSRPTPTRASRPRRLRPRRDGARAERARGRSTACPPSRSSRRADGSPGSSARRRRPSPRSRATGSCRSRPAPGTSSSP